jgi:hypothetical protein
MQSACAILSSVASLAPLHFLTLSHKQQDFRKKVIEFKTCLLIFSINLSIIFLIIKRIQGDIAINVKMSSCKVAVIFVIS